jgi:hypothetical protein
MTNIAHGAVAHFDIAGDDAEKLVGFYVDIFGWAIAPQGPGYSLIETPNGSPNGAVVEAEEPGLTMGVTVENLDETRARVKAAGGDIVMPATDNGWVTKARITDVSGNSLTLIQA